MLTRSELMNALAHVDPRARDLIAGANGPARHRARVEATRLAAITSTGRALGAWALLMLDINGIGGHAGAGDAGGRGFSTSRHPAFAGLGKGRKQATDGQAWMAAAEQARDELADELSEPRLTAQDGELCAVDGEDYYGLPDDEWARAWARGRLLELGKVDVIDDDWAAQVAAWSLVAFPHPEELPEEPEEPPKKPPA